MKKNTDRYDLATQIDSVSDETLIEICNKYGATPPTERKQLINAAIWSLYMQHFCTQGVKAVLLKADEKKVLLTFVRNPQGEEIPTYKWNETILAAVTKIKKELKIGTILIKKQICSVDTDKFPAHVVKVSEAKKSTGKEMIKKLDEDGLMAEKYRIESMSMKTPEEIAAAREARDAKLAEEAALKMSNRQILESSVKTAIAVTAIPELEEPSISPIVVNKKEEQSDDVQNVFEFKIGKDGQLCFI